MLCNICIMQLAFFSSLLSHRTYPKWISSVIHLWSFSFKQLKLGCLAASIHLGQLVTATERERERDKISDNRWASYHLPWGLDSFRNLKRLRSLVMAGVFFERVWRRGTKGGGELNRLSVRPSFSLCSFENSIPQSSRLRVAAAMTSFSSCRRSYENS